MKRIVANLSFLIVISLLFIPTACLAIYGVLALIPPPSAPEEEAEPSWSSDGQYFAYVCYLAGPTEGWSQSEITFNFNPPSPETPWSEYTDDAADICIVESSGRNRRRLTQELGQELGPVWSPDGTQIAYLRHEGIYVIDAGGHNQRRLISERRIYKQKISWSPDGTRLLFSACLDNPDYDLYLVNVDNGAITNLTPASRKHEIDPSWTFNGTKIFFLSTASSVWPDNCGLKEDTPHQMKVINVDGSGEQVIYRELYYPYVSVSTAGQIAFVSDLISRTSEEYFGSPNSDNKRVFLYKLTMNNAEPVEIPTENVYFGTPSPITYSWSPNGKYLLYKDKNGKFKTFDIETGEVRELPPVQPPIIPLTEFFFEIGIVATTPAHTFSWAPDNQQVAVTGYLSTDKGGGYESQEKHIYLLNLQEGTTRLLFQK